ncbi:DUF2637 domain-containing protein [Mycolicibacterium thermoresistibile]
MNTTRSGPADLARRNHSRAVRFFWAWLILATCVSLAGNVVHAWLVAAPDARWLAAGVAAVPPMVLLLSVHGLALLAKANASGVVYWASVCATGILAMFAFALSFVALRDLAVLAGIRPGLAPVLPLVIDLAIGVATLALVAIGDKPARRIRPAGRSAAVPATSGAVANRDPASATAITTGGDAASPRRPSPTYIADQSTRDLAVALVAEKATGRQPLEVVERILTAYDSGDPPNRIAKNLRVHHSAVSRVIEAAAVHRQGVLEAV